MISEAVVHMPPPSSGDIRFVPNRVCIPIGMACNVKCSYCLRNAGRIREPKGLSPLMRRFLSQLDPDQTEAVVINGGEPLLYMDRIREVFDLVSPKINRVVMTNGTLLTPAVTDYLLSQNVELHFSHEGTGAMELKGVDVLTDERIVEQLNRFKKMRCYNILTAKNQDCVANYEYIRQKITVEKFYFTAFPMFAFAGNEYLVKEFDFDFFTRSLSELYELYPETLTHDPSNQCRRQTGVNVLPDGSIASIATLKVYGSVLNTRDEILAAIHQCGDDAFCRNRDCDVRESCYTSPQCATPFTCRAMETEINVHRAMEHAGGIFRR